MMHRLFLAFYPFDMLPDAEANRFYETYLALQNGTNPLFTYMALRYFEVGLQFFMRQDYKIVFLFDEFDEMLRQLPVKFFQTLRGIRDANKRNLLYITFTRSPLPTLLERFEIPMLDIEPFIELFNDNVYYVGPYNDKDARKMYNELLRSSQKNTLMVCVTCSSRRQDAMPGFCARVLPRWKNLAISSRRPNPSIRLPRCWRRAVRSAPNARPSGQVSTAPNSTF